MTEIKNSMGELKEPKKFIARYITVELLKTKKRKKYRKKMKEKQHLNYTEKMIQIADISSETTQSKENVTTFLKW